MITFTGIHVTQEYGTPNLRDIAVQSMRIARFCGSGGLWLPIGIHVLVVADILAADPETAHLEHHGLLHDSPEVCVNDVPRPMKTNAARKLEDKVLARIYREQGLKLPTAREQALVKAADIRAVNVEGVMECGPRGFGDIQQNIDRADCLAAFFMRRYLDQFKPEDAINPNGRWPLELESRLRVAVTQVHNRAKVRKIKGF